MFKNNLAKKFNAVCVTLWNTLHLSMTIASCFVVSKARGELLRKEITFRSPALGRKRAMTLDRQTAARFRLVVLPSPGWLCHKPIDESEKKQKC